MKFFKTLLTLALFTFVLSVPVLAEENANVEVSVTEQNGVIPKAVVMLDSIDNGFTRRLTNSEGVATFTGVTPGKFNLRVTFIGFADYNKEVEIKAGDNKFDVSMTLSKFSETIEISTPNRKIELLKNVAEPTTVVDEATIRDTGGRSAKDVLLEQGGAGVKVEAGGGQGYISINGVSNNGVLILIDGRRYLGKNSLGNVDLEDLDMSRFERVEIVKGAGSAMYGSEALAGVVNFITKKADYEGFQNTMDFNYGSYNDVKFADTLTYSSRDVDASFSGSYRKFDGYDLDEDNPQTVGLPESEYFTANGNIEYKGHDRIRLRGIFDYNLRKVENYFFTGATQLGEQVYDSQRRISRHMFSPEVEVILTDTTLFTGRYTYSKYLREETQVYPSFSTEVSPWEEWQNEVVGTLSHGYSLGGEDHSIQVGYEFRKEQMDRANLVFPDSGSSEVERDVNVFWASNEFNFTEKFKITAGFRYDDYSDFGDEFSPKVSAIFAINDEHRIRASYGHGFRAPRFGELYLDLGAFFKGNPELNPEISDNFTLGIAHTGQWARGSLDFFYNKIENGIVFDFSQFPFGPISYTNLEEYTAQGINTELSINLPYGFTPSAAYSFVQREDEEGEEILSYPKHSGYVKLAWANPRLGMRANIRGQFNDEVEFSDGTSQPSYQVWDAQVSKSLFTTGMYSVSVFGQVDNIFDETDIFLRDPSGAAIPGDFQIWLPPRTYLIGITVDMDFSKN